MLTANLQYLLLENIEYILNISALIIQKFNSFAVLHLPRKVMESCYSKSSAFYRLFFALVA